MRKLLFIVAFFIGALCSYGQCDYYWYEGKKIHLESVETEYFIYYESSSLESYLEKQPSEQLLRKGEYTSADIRKSLPANAHWALVTSSLFETIRENFLINYFMPNYKLPTGGNVGVSNLFYVKLKTKEDYKHLKSLAEEYSLDILGNDETNPLLYILKCNISTDINALCAANLFYESGRFEYAEPDLMGGIKLACANDSLFSQQWNINGSRSIGYGIGFCETSTLTLGDPSIVVAIIDEGVDKQHPDLQNIHSASFHCEAEASPSALIGNHGTKCAGIIGAKPNNGIGVAGIAPNCPIMVISSFLQSSADGMRVIAKGFDFAVNNGASVISNSWRSLYNSSTLNDAILNAIRNGRNGLGCVVVFAAGNENSSVAYPANFNDSILVVGAMSPCGERKNPNSCDGENWGSNYGTKLDVVAPGVNIPTTTIHTQNDGYVTNFNGTSAACPHAAAVAALILSLNPSLTQKEVCDIIEGSAQKIRPDLYTYGNYSNRSNGTWNQEVGYGLLDAAAALEVVCPTVFYNNHTVTSNTTVSGCTIKVSNVVIQNNANVVFDAEQTTTINGPFQVNLGSTLEVR